MTTPPELVQCSHCKHWFAGAALDEVFYHATCACRRDDPSTRPSDPTETR